jgi:autotransporter-associated beta strand protein
MTIMKSNFQLITTLACAMLGGSSLYATDGTWANSAGNWSDSTKWVGGTIATGAPGTVYYPKNVNATLTVDSNRTIGQFWPLDAGSGLNKTTWTIDSSGGAVLTIGTPYVIRPSGGKIVIKAPLGGTGGVQFTLRVLGTGIGDAPATLVLAATNIYSGTTVLINQINATIPAGNYEGTLQIAVPEAIPHGPGKGIVQFDPYSGSGNTSWATVDLMTNNATVNALSGNDGRVNSSDTAAVVTLTVGDGDASGTFGGVIENGLTGATLALTKIGAGTQTLTGVNTYTGATTVNGGTLAVNGSINSTVTVNTGGTLGGTGTVNGFVQVTAGGKINAGNSAGILTLANGLDMSPPNTTCVWELAANSTATPGTDFDRIVVAGGADVTDANLNIQFTGTATAPDGTGFWTSDHSWLIMSGTVTGNFKNIQNGTNVYGSFYTTVSGSGVTLNFKFSGVVPAAKPRITSITGAGTASVTVNYNNCVVGKTYFLQYKSPITGTWTTIGSGKVAGSASDFQTDATASGSQRYYQVYYVP